MSGLKGKIEKIANDGYSEELGYNEVENAKQYINTALSNVIQATEDIEKSKSYFTKYLSENGFNDQEILQGIDQVINLLEGINDKLKSAMDK